MCLDRCTSLKSVQILNIQATILLILKIETLIQFTVLNFHAFYQTLSLKTDLVHLFFSIKRFTLQKRINHLSSDLQLGKGRLALHFHNAWPRGEHTSRDKNQSSYWLKEGLF